MVSPFPKVVEARGWSQWIGQSHISVDGTNFQVSMTYRKKVIEEYLELQWVFIPNPNPNSNPNPNPNHNPNPNPNCNPNPNPNPNCNPNPY